MKKIKLIRSYLETTKSSDDSSSDHGSSGLGKSGHKTIYKMQLQDNLRFIDETQFTHATQDRDHGA